MAKIHNEQRVIGVEILSGSGAAADPLTNAQLTAVTGAASAPAWAGTGNGTVIAILKAIHAQNAQMITLLNDIKTNTSSS